MADFLTLKTVDQILTLLEDFDPLPTEEIPLEAALGRVLAAPYLAPADLPGFNRSTVDGFAVRARDVFGASEGLPAALTLVGEGRMGQDCSLTLNPGETIRVWTGGALPPQSDAVVMLEYARTSQAGLVELVKPLAPGENVILADEDAAKDQELIPIGQTLRAAELGLMAAFGETVVSVRRKPKFAILATGDEVVKITDAPKIGQVRDINSIAIKALVEAAGGLGELLGLVPDDLPLLSQKVATGLALADAVVLTGGSSAGEKDYTLKALTAQPGTAALAHGVAISPGKPLIFARQGQKSLWGLPGHPAGALVTAEVFLKALIRRLTGAKEPIWPKALKARLSRSVPSAEGRRDYFRVKLTFKGQELIASPVLGKSALISTLAGADALAICPEEREGLEQGEWADIRLL